MRERTRRPTLVYNRYHPHYHHYYQDPERYINASLCPQGHVFRHECAEGVVIALISSKDGEAYCNVLATPCE